MLGDPALAAKALDTFARQAEVLEFKGGLMGDTVLDADELRQLGAAAGAATSSTPSWPASWPRR